MKPLLITFFLLYSLFSFSQVQKDEQKNNTPLFISTIDVDTSYIIHNNLSVVTNSIKTISTSKKHIDNRNFVALTSKNNKIYKFSDLSSKINLNQALDNVMFTGNFFNPEETHFSTLLNENN